MFFGGEHENRENQIRCNEHFDEHPLDRADTVLQTGATEFIHYIGIIDDLDIKDNLLVAARTRRECQYGCRGGDRPSKLSDAK